MKALTSLIILLLSGLSMAQSLPGQFDPKPVTVIKTLLDETHTATLRVNENTFIPNIQGYACAVPAINVDRWIMRNSRIRRSSYADFMVNFAALTIHNPNMQFCSGWVTAQQLFGEEFKIGAQFELEIHTLRQIVETEDWNGNPITKVIETVSTELNGRKMSAFGELLL